MPNAETHRASAPISGGIARAASPVAPAGSPATRADGPADGIASVVERALCVLREHSVRAPAAPSGQPWAFEPTLAPGVGELHNRLEQLRYQAQDLVDELVRAIESLAAASTSTSSVAVPSRSTAPATTALGAASLSNLSQLRRAVAVAGQAASIHFDLVNDAQQPVEVLVKATSLIGPHGFEVPSRYVGFSPNPLLLQAGETQPVEVTIRMPEQVPPGEYSGLVQGVGLEGAHAQLTVDVRPMTGAG